MESHHRKLLRVGVFYDGNFFHHVSNYYKYYHPRRARISIPGLHDLIRQLVAKEEGSDVRYCHIVDAHFFRGRYPAKDAEAQQRLFSDRVMDDILTSEGVVTHYLPIRGKAEKGIDVWLALEAYELSVLKRFDVVVLIAGDGDFVPLARKVNSLGTRMMVLGWDFRFTDDGGVPRETVTSVSLLQEVTYPVLMHHLIEDRTRRDDPVLRNLFVEPRPGRPAPGMAGTGLPPGSGSFAAGGPSGALPQTTDESTETALMLPPTSGSLFPSPTTMLPPAAPHSSPMASVSPGSAVGNGAALGLSSPLPPVNSSQSPPSSSSGYSAGSLPTAVTLGAGKRYQGEICSVRDGYGFIRCADFPNNIFFFWNELRNRDFSELTVGEKVSFEQGQNERGPIALRIETIPV